MMVSLLGLEKPLLSESEPEEKAKGSGSRSAQALAITASMESSMAVLSGSAFLNEPSAGSLSSMLSRMWMFSLPIRSLSIDSGTLCRDSVLLGGWEPLAEPTFGLFGLLGLFVLPGDFFRSLDGLGD